MATYCVGDLAFMVDGTNSQGEQFRNHLYRLIFLLRRRFPFLSRRLNEWWDFPVFFSANNYWIITGGGGLNSLLEKGDIKFSSWDTKRTRQTDREIERTYVCLSVCLSVCFSGLRRQLLDNNWRGVSILSQEKGDIKFSSWDTKRTRQRERQRHTSVCLSLCLSVFLSVCLSVFYRDEMSLMKSDNKNQREREREKERIPLNEFVEEFPYFWKVAPVFVEPKKSSSLGKRHFNYFLEEWREKMSHTK